MHDHLSNDQDPREVQALQRDVTLLADHLAAAEIEILWLAAVRDVAGFGADGVAPSGSDWLAMIADGCTRWLTGRSLPRAGVSAADAGSAAVQDELRDLVLHEIAVFDREAGTMNRWRDEGLFDALRRCTRECPPDLGFRFLMRIAHGLPQQVSPDQYRRLVPLGQALGCGDYVVSDLEYLVGQR